MPFQVTYPLLEALRAQRGESRTDLARLLRIGHIHEKFTGTRLFTANDRRRLAKYFRTPATELFSRKSTIQDECYPTVRTKS